MGGLPWEKKIKISKLIKNLIYWYKLLEETLLEKMYKHSSLELIRLENKDNISTSINLIRNNGWSHE
jgi:hypothetical protein